MWFTNGANELCFLKRPANHSIFFFIYFKALVSKQLKSECPKFSIALWIENEDQTIFPMYSWSMM